MKISSVAELDHCMFWHSLSLPHSSLDLPAPTVHWKDVMK